MEIIILVLLGVILLVILINQRKKPEKDESTKREFEFMQKVLSEMKTESRENLQNIRIEVQKELSENRKNQTMTNKDINERLDKSAQVISQVQKQLGGLNESQKQMQDIGKNISSLQEILRNSKARGGFGEIMLENLLAQILPNNFQMQYTFKTGERADAILKLKDNKIVAIDSKFPLEDFQRFLDAESEEEKRTHKKALITRTKKHVDDVAKKYILPDENTLDFAFLYIPAENVYYELVTGEENILEYAWKKKICIVSPNSFFAYLITVLEGLRALQIEKNVQDILVNLSKLNNDFGRFGEDFRKIGTHLKNAGNAYESSEKRMDKFNTTLEKTISAGEVDNQNKLEI